MGRAGNKTHNPKGIARKDVDDGLGRHGWAILTTAHLGGRKNPPTYGGSQAGEYRTVREGEHIEENSENQQDE